MDAPKTTVVSFLLDETGSMEPTKPLTIEGFNKYVDGLRDESAGKVEFSLLKFNSSKIEKVYVGAPMDNVHPLTDMNYKPDHMTPLYDAMCKTIQATQVALEQRTDEPLVLVVIQTDGEENASREFGLSDVQDMVKEKTNAGWQFVFLGANIDAWAIASQIGLSHANTMSYAASNTGDMFDALAENTKSYRTTGMAASLSFTPQQRARASQSTPPPSSSGSRTGSQTRSRSGSRTSLVDDIDLTQRSE